MEKCNNSSGHEEGYSCELPNLYFELKFFAGPPPKRFDHLSEQELNQLVEQGHSALGGGPPKNNKLVCINPSRLVMHSGNFRENFSAIWRQ